jgi:NADH dehydrogenase
MLAEGTGAETDRAGRISVQPDCTLPGHPEVFAIGDMMSLDGLPGVAEVAMQQGIHASSTIKRRLKSDETAAFRYRDLGSMATISKFRAVVSFKGIRLSGFLGWCAWLFVHLAFLTGFKNRFTTVFGWAMAFIGNGRPERTITGQEVIARVAIEQAGGRSFLLGLASGGEEEEEADGAGAQPG